MAVTDEHIEPLLDRYRTGELGPADQARVAAHVEACGACRVALAELEAFSTAVSRGYAAAREGMPVPDWAQQREAILARTSARPSRRWGWLSGWVPQAAAAALAVIAVGVLWRAEIREPIDADRAVAPVTTGADAADGARDARPVDTRTEAADESADATFSSRTSPAPGAGAALEPAAPSISRDRAERQEQEAGRRQNERLDQPAAPEGLADREADLETARERANADGADADQAVGEAEKERQGRETAQPAAREAPAELRAEQKAAAENQVSEPAARAVDKARVVDVGSRFELQARGALADRDTLAAGRTYALWRDTLATGDALTPERRAALQALADSLATLLAARP